jgi:hypothetical protein
MKTLIFLTGITIMGLLIPPPDKNIAGTWVLQGTDVQPVFRIHMGEGIWKGTIDMPEQEVYDKEIHSIRVNKDSVFIKVYKDGPVINARMTNDSTLEGETQKEDRVDRFTFKRAELYH